MVQEQVDNFCQDVQDALTRGGSQDPEDAAERLEELQETAQDLVNVVASGKVKIPVNQRYALADVVQAHRDLESRKTTGTTVLLP